MTAATMTPIAKSCKLAVVQGILYNKIKQQIGEDHPFSIHMRGKIK